MSSKSGIFAEPAHRRFGRLPSHSQGVISHRTGQPTFSIQDGQEFALPKKSVSEHLTSPLAAHGVTALALPAPDGARTRHHDKKDSEHKDSDIKDSDAHLHSASGVCDSAGRYAAFPQCPGLVRHPQDIAGPAAAASRLGPAGRLSEPVRAASPGPKAQAASRPGPYRRT